MYNYIDFDFNFTFHKAMKEKVPGDRGDLLSARVSEILIAALYFCLVPVIRNINFGDGPPSAARAAAKGNV